jgi:hypothetical protein
MTEKEYLTVLDTVIEKHSACMKPRKLRIKQVDDVLKLHVECEYQGDAIDLFHLDGLATALGAKTANATAKHYTFPNEDGSMGHGTKPNGARLEGEFMGRKIELCVCCTNPS